MTLVMLGSTCSKVMRMRSLPAARAASTNSRAQMALAEPRARRAKTGTLKMPMAMIEVTAPGPKMAVIMMAERMAGKAKVKSLSRITISSTQPRMAEASRPKATPASTPMPTATKPTSSEFCAPTRIIESTSRPKWSVPSRWPNEGVLSLSVTTMSSTE